jgi:broad specificity phosphatase PhoE
VQTIDFFNNSNAEALALRDGYARQALEDMATFFDEGGEAAIFDSTMSTKRRRQWMHEWLVESSFSGELCWVERQLSDAAAVSASALAALRHMPDFEGMSDDEARGEFVRRVDMYKASYEPLDDDDIRDGFTSFVTVVNDSEKVNTNRIQGYLLTRVVFFLMNLRSTKEHPIYITRHGQSEYNVRQLLG